MVIWQNKVFFDKELQTILDLFEINIKKMRNTSFIIVPVFINWNIIITKTFELKVRFDRGVIKDLIYSNTFKIGNNQ